jgi:hypothetical protein
MVDWLEDHFGAVMIVWAIIWLALFVGFIWVMVHFVSKYW